MSMYQNGVGVGVGVGVGEFKGLPRPNWNCLEQFDPRLSMFRIYTAFFVKEPRTACAAITFKFSDSDSDSDSNSDSLLIHGHGFSVKKMENAEI